MIQKCKCCQCGKTNKQLHSDNDDLRPYGPDGAPICHACAHSTEELEREARMRQGEFAAVEALSMVLQAKAGQVPVYGADSQRH